jgi:hypothetical protein
VIRKWNSTRQQVLTQNLSGFPVALFSVGERLCAVASIAGRPRFTLLSSELEILSTGPVSNPNPDPQPEPEPEPEPISFSAANGTFYATLSPPIGTGGLLRSSTLKLSLNTKGRASGSLSTGGKAIPFRTKFDENGEASLELMIAGQPATLKLRVVLTEAGATLTGSLETNHWTMAVSGSRARQRTRAGLFTFILNTEKSASAGVAPPVPGYGFLKIARTGTARAAGWLAPGVPMAQGSWVLDDGSVILSLKTPNGNSSLVGRIIPADLPESDWSGVLQWEKKASLRTFPYSHEIRTEVTFTGTEHQGAEPPLGPNQADGVTIIASGGDLQDPLLVHASIVSDGLVLPRAFGDRRAAASIDPRNSAVNGYFVHPRTGVPIPFGGVVNSKLHEVHGGFLGTGLGGKIRIAPGLLSPGAGH